MDRALTAGLGFVGSRSSLQSPHDKITSRSQHLEEATSQWLARDRHRACHYNDLVLRGLRLPATVNSSGSASRERRQSVLDGPAGWGRRDPIPAIHASPSAAR